MKRLIVIALLATMMIGVTGCGNSKNTSSSTTTTTTQSTTQSTTVTTNASSANTNSVAANVYDGTGEKQGKKLVSIKWSEKDKINVINSMLHTNNVITKSGEVKKRPLRRLMLTRFMKLNWLTKTTITTTSLFILLTTRFICLAKNLQRMRIQKSVVMLM